MGVLCVVGPVTDADDHNYGTYMEAKNRLHKRYDRVVVPFIPGGIFIGAYAFVGRALKPDVTGVALLDGWDDCPLSHRAVVYAETSGIPCKTVDEWMEETL